MLRRLETMRNNDGSNQAVYLEKIDSTRQARYLKYKNSHMNGLRLTPSGFKVPNRKRNINGTISSSIIKDSFIIIKSG